MAETEVSIEDVLNGTDEPEAPKVEEETPPEPEAQTEEAEPQGEVEESTEAEPPAAKDEPKENRVDPDQFKGYLDEREKRQNLERELEQLRQQLSTQKTETPTPADPVEDPEGFREQTQAEIQQAKFEMQRELMTENYEDYAKAEDWVNSQLGNNPLWAERLRASTNVPKAAYKMWQDHQKLEQIENIDSYKAQLKEELRKELSAEMRGEVEKEAEEEVAKDEAIKPSLAKAGNAGMSTEAVVSMMDEMGGDPFNKPT